MASPRLSDSQKQELVARYRTGQSASALAQSYGCSANTISRVVKSLLDPEELASLKKQPRGRAASQTERPVTPRDEAVGPEAADTDDAAEAAEAQPDPIPVAAEIQATEGQPASNPADSLLPEASLSDEEPASREAPSSSLAIDDADDFGDDNDEFGDDSDEEGDSDSDAPAAASMSGVTVLISPASGAESSAGTQGVIQPLPLAPGVLPTSLYLLVDKTVELEARPLREFSELGPLPQDEQDRQALMLFVNPRQAKRQCGRSQRVIKVPDSAVLQRTAPYLVAQGITRLVLEGGSLFAVPGT
jgi:transposase-like protein